MIDTDGRERDMTDEILYLCIYIEREEEMIDYR